jgi:hypothetical protein
MSRTYKKKKTKKKNEIQPEFGKNLGYILLFAAIAMQLYMLRDLPFFEHIDSGGDNYWHHTNAMAIVQMLQQGKLLAFYENGNLGWPMLNVYQPLLYILEAVLYLGLFKSIPIHTIHNLLETLFIAMVPAGTFYMLLKMQAGRFTAGLAAMFSILSIFGWGASMESYFNLGMATFAAGMAFFPFAVGKYYQLLHTESWHSKDIAAVAILTTLSFLGHQLAGYALFIAFATITILKIFLMAFSNKPKKHVLQIFKRASLAGILSILMLSFFIFPKFLTHSEYNAKNYALLRVTDSAVPSFTTQFFIDKLFNAEMLDSTNNFGLEKDTNFRWAYNKHHSRLPIVTFFFLLGTIITILKIDEEKNKTLLCLFIAFLTVSLSFDDFPIIRYLPATKELPYMRLMSFLYLFISAIAAVGLTYCIQFLTNSLPKQSETQ